VLLIGAVLFGAAPGLARGENAPPPVTFAPQTSSLDNTMVAGESTSEDPVRRLVKWNEFDGKYFSLRVGGGLLVEYDAYARDAESRQQFRMFPTEKLPDARVLLKGSLKFFISRKVTHSMGIMYDAADEEWGGRQTGLMIEVPEIWGHLLVGRTME
jgi:hypothetical protein